MINGNPGTVRDLRVRDRAATTRALSTGTVLTDAIPIPVDLFLCPGDTRPADPVPRMRTRPA